MHTIEKISHHPSLPKRGFIPPFGKGRLGGILQSMFSIIRLLTSDIKYHPGCQKNKECDGVVRR